MAMGLVSAQAAWIDIDGRQAFAVAAFLRDEVARVFLATRGDNGKRYFLVSSTHGGDGCPHVVYQWVSE